MKAKAILTALLGILLAGCALRGKPAKSAAPPAAPMPAATPAPPPPPPLSIPQTRVQLPEPQPVDPAALAPEATPPEPPPAAAAPARSRRAGQPASQPASQPAGPPPAATAPPEPRETVQEIVPPAELNRLRNRTDARRREVNQILNQFARRQLTDAQRNVVATIRNFLTLSQDAAKRNDLRQADALAERAQILAKELQSGK